MGSGQSAPPAIQYPSESTITFTNVWDNASQSLILDADSLTNEGNASFFNPKDNKFYSRLLLTPNPTDTSYPRNMNIEVVKFSKGSFVIGHELNNSGTQFTLQLYSLVQYRVNGPGGSVKNFRLSPGTYTCSNAGLNTEDIQPGKNKLCYLEIKSPQLKITGWPNNDSTLLVFDNQVPRY